MTTMYVVARKRADGKMEFAGSMANGYVMTKIRSNAMKSLKSCALTERGEKFYLLKAVASAQTPTDLLIEDFEEDY